MALMTDKQFLILGGVAVVGGLVLAYQGRKVIKDVKKTVQEVVTEDLNPASRTNVVNEAFTNTWRWVLNDDDWTLGGWIYDITHDDPLLGGATSNGQVMY